MYPSNFRLNYRVAESPAVKMPIGNLAKVFGPTIVGYSENDLDAQTMLRETKKQQMVLETLLSINERFWKQFVYSNLDQGKLYTSESGGTTRGKSNAPFLPHTPQAPAPLSSIGRYNGKKIYFSDDSPKESVPMKTRSQKRSFFD